MTLNPENEKQLNDLAELCKAELEGDSELASERTDALLKSLLMSGFTRNSPTILQIELEKRIKKICPQIAQHRGAAITGVTGRMQSKFNELKQWESSAPQTDSPPKAANISSATDA
jgi:hypothetical protein